MPRTTTTRPASAKPEPAKQETPQTIYGEKEPGSLNGNLTREFDLRYTTSGRAVANSSIAVNDRVRNDETGKWEDTETEFYEVTVWGTLAENCVEVFAKGDRVVAIGYFQDETYTSRQSGEIVTKTTFTASDLGASLLFKSLEIKRVTRAAK